MRDLRNSVVLLILYFSIVLGIAQVEGFENNVLNFQAAFFVMLAIATALGVLSPARVQISLYGYIFIWAVVYALVWTFYWRFLIEPRSIQELGVQFLLIEISAGLSYAVGQNISSIDSLLEGLSSSTYPNRTVDMKEARDQINTELTRSRRYNRPLSVLILEFEKANEESKSIEAVQKDLLKRFTLAKVGQILNEHARQTDLIMDDQTEHFIIVCPETDYQATEILAGRIRQAVKEKLGAWVMWGTASFPNEALTFDDLLNTARGRISRSGTPVEFSPTLTEIEVPRKQV